MRFRVLMRLLICFLFREILLAKVLFWIGDLSFLICIVSHIVIVLFPQKGGKEGDKCIRSCIARVAHPLQK